MLTKEQILEADDIKTETVHVPEWDGYVTVKVLTGTELDAYEVAIVGDGKKRNMTNLRSGLLARAIVDEYGKRMFTDNEIDALGRKSATALDRVFTVVKRINGRTEKDLEELEKNSGLVQSDASTSD